MHIHTIQLNIEKIIGGTIGMDATEFGAYMSLLIACYQSQNQLPNDDKKLAYIARVSPKVWKRIKPIIAQKFTKSDLHWSHLVVQKELEKCVRLSTKNRANALKKNKTDKPVAKRSHSQKQANTNNNNQITNNYNIPPYIPQNLWDDYLIHRNKVKAGMTDRAIKSVLKKLDVFYQSGHDPVDILETSIMNGWKGIFEPNAERKVNGNHDPIKSELSDFLDSLGG